MAWLCALAAALGPASPSRVAELSGQAPLRPAAQPYEAAAGERAEPGATWRADAARVGMRAMIVPFSGMAEMVSQVLPGGVIEELHAEAAAPSALIEEHAASDPGTATTGAVTGVTKPVSDEAEVKALLAKLKEVETTDSILPIGTPGANLAEPTDREFLSKLPAHEKVKYVEDLVAVRKKLCTSRGFNSGYSVDYAKCIKEDGNARAMTLDLLFLTEHMDEEQWLFLHGAWVEFGGTIGFLVLLLVIWVLVCKGKTRRPFEGDSSTPADLAVGDFHPVTICACLKGLPRTVGETLCCYLCMWGETVEKLGYGTFHSAMGLVAMVYLLPLFITGILISSGVEIWSCLYVYITFECCCHVLLFAAIVKSRVSLRTSHKQESSEPAAASRTRDVFMDLLCILCCRPCALAQEAEFVEVYEKHKSEIANK